MIRTAVEVLLAATLMVVSLPRMAAASAGPERASFSRVVANVEFSARQLSPQQPGQVIRPPVVEGPLWYGVVARHDPAGGQPHPKDRSVPFAVRYAGSEPVAVWWDANENGDLTDDPPPKLYSYPAIAGARAFLVDLRWNARRDSVEIPVDWTVRIVLEPARGDSSEPIVREQMVYAMQGTVRLQGKTHRAFLFDGNADGIYTKDFGDGIFVDLDDDLRFDVDQFSSSFGPFRIPFQMGERTYAVDSVDVEGRWLMIREIGAVEASSAASVGQPAPDFAFRDLDGREVRLSDYRRRPIVVQFFASWCGLCRDQAEALAALYDRYRPLGLILLGISYDTDGAALESFRASHRQTWPVSFSGGKFFENPIGRLYHADGAGMLYLVDQKGMLSGTFTNVDSLAQGVTRLMTLSAGGAR